MHWLVTLFFFLTACCATAQTIPNENKIEELLEMQAEQLPDEAMEGNTIIDELLYLSQHPINLNHTNTQELQALQLLNDLQINYLLQHINKNGKLLSLYELQSINGFDISVIQQLLPYITIDTNDKLFTLNKKTVLKEAQHSITFRYGQVLEKQKGFQPWNTTNLKSPNSHYIGSPQKLLFTYRYNLNQQIKLGFTADKDPGEVFFTTTYPNDSAYLSNFKKIPQKGFDFYAAYLMINNYKVIKTFLIGDYTLSFGQGLTLWNTASFNSSTDILQLKKNGTGIRPHTSADESRFMRGIASTLQFSLLQFTFFYSQKPADAIINDTLPATVSIQQSGLHTTPSQINAKHTVLQTTFGSHIHFEKKSFSTGFTIFSDQLFIRPASIIDKKQQIKNTTINMGSNYQYLFKNFLLFGECSWNESFSNSLFKNGLFISTNSSVSFTIVHRYFPKQNKNEPQNLFSQAAEHAEKGVIMGISWKLTTALTGNFSFDRFEYSWLRYLVDAPSNGYAFLGHVNYSLNKKTNTAFSFRHQNKQQNTRTFSVMPILESVQTTNYRLTLAYPATSTILFKSRIDLLHYQFGNNKQTGYVLLHDMKWKLPNYPLSLTTRYALFYTNSYDSRLYEYENDIPGSYSVIPYYDKGSRIYALMNYSFKRFIEIWIRYSQSIYENKNKISAGSLSEINGNTKSELKVQLRFQF